MRDFDAVFDRAKLSGDLRAAAARIGIAVVLLSVVLSCVYVLYWAANTSLEDVATSLGQAVKAFRDAAK